MTRRRGDIEFEDVLVGNGDFATREHIATVQCTMRLHRGEIVGAPGEIDVDLSRRVAIAGLRYGIEGMRVGGIRRIPVPPHLGYGDEGHVTSGIPHKALLVCEVSLLRLRPAH